MSNCVYKAVIWELASTTYSLQHIMVSS